VQITCIHASAHMRCSMPVAAPQTCFVQPALLHYSTLLLLATLAAVIRACWAVSPRQYMLLFVLLLLLPGPAGQCERCGVQQ
jgi:hypothetical protein